MVLLDSELEIEISVSESQIIFLVYFIHAA